MSDIFLATLGKRPEAITVAFDRLSEVYTFSGVVVLHTHAHESEIAAAAYYLRGIFNQDYPRLTVHWHELKRRDGSVLLDIADPDAAWDYYYGVLAVLLHYRREHHHLHLMVSGGRKAMSVYATLAATLVFNGQDRLWSVLSPSEMIERKGVFHIPHELHDQVQVVELPVLPTRLVLEEANISPDIQLLLQQRRNRLAHFRGHLSEAENILLDMLKMRPHATDAELGALLGKSGRTVENQLRRVYVVMEIYFDFEHRLPQKRKRQMLVDILLERV